TYCAECGYEPQTAALARALMDEFGDKLAAIEIIPAHDGSFDVRVGGDLVHGMHREGGFPEHETIVRAVRQRLAAAYGGKAGETLAVGPGRRAVVTAGTPRGSWRWPAPPTPARTLGEGSLAVLGGVVGGGAAVAPARVAAGCGAAGRGTVTPCRRP